jgi:hypothetical protein
MNAWRGQKPSHRIEWQPGTDNAAPMETSAMATLLMNIFAV